VDKQENKSQLQKYLIDGDEPMGREVNENVKVYIHDMH
jgi:hypothetical protein